MIRFAALIAAIAFAFVTHSAIAQEAAPAAEPPPTKSKTIEYIVCTAHAQVMGTVMAELDRKKARPYFTDARDCLDRKFPEALAEAEGHADLTAAIKDHYVKAQVWAKDYGNGPNRVEFREAIERVEMEAKLAKK